MAVAALQQFTLEPAPQPAGAAAAGSHSALDALRGALPVHLRGQVRSARELTRQRTATPVATALPTAVPGLDRLLEGGLPRGQLVEIIGHPSSGRFSLALAALRAATAAGEAAALIDLGDNLDPQVATREGVDLERLLWLRPERMKQALVGGEMLLASGFPLVVIEVGPPPVAGGRSVEAAWLRLARAAEVHQGALLVCAPYRVSGTAAAIVLRAQRSRSLWRHGNRTAPHLLTGLTAHLVLEKARRRARGEIATVEMRIAPPSSPPPAGRMR